MNKDESALQVLLDQKLLPLYYHESEEVSVEVLRALYSAGIRTLEYTNRGAHAYDNFKKLRRVADAEMPHLQLGVGTIKTVTAAELFIEAGADFIVCPSVNVEVGKAVQDAGLLWVPGCLTTTEIANAENAGALLVKIFPGNILGPSYISAIKEIFPGVRFMPTGGVDTTEKNIRSWFEAGAVAVGMGSKLITKEVLEGRHYDEIRTNTMNLLRLIKKV